jgi:hypothetical protein
VTWKTAVTEAEAAVGVCTLALGATILLLLFSVLFRRDFLSLFTPSPGAGPAMNQSAGRTVEDSAQRRSIPSGYCDKGCGRGQSSFGSRRAAGRLFRRNPGTFYRATRAH